jgi:hypothetical protein
VIIGNIVVVVPVIVPPQFVDADGADETATEHSSLTSGRLAISGVTDEGVHKEVITT